MYMSTQLFRSMIAFLCLFSNIKNIHSHRCTRDLSIYTKRLLVSKKVAEGIRGRSCVLKPKDLRGRNEQQWNCFLIYFGYTENVDVDAKLLVLKTFNESDTKLCESCYIFETGGQIYKRKDGIGLGFQEKGRFILIHDPETNVIGLYALLSLTQGSFFNIGRDGLQFGNYQDDYLSVKRPCVSILIKFFVRTKEFSEVNKKLNLGIDEKSKYIVKLEKINQDTMKFQNYTKKEDIKENADISGNSPLNSNSHNNMNQTGNDQPVRVEPIPLIPIDDKKKQSRFYRSASSDKDKIKVGQSNVSKGSNVSEQSCMPVQGVVTHQSNEPEQTNESKQTGDSEQTDDSEQTSESEQSFVSEQTNEQKQQIISKQTTVSKQSFVSEQPTVLKQTDKSFKSTIFEQTTVSIVTLREEQPYSSLRPAVTEETCKLRQLVLSEQMYKANEKAVSKQLFVSEEHGISKKQIFLKQPQIAEESNIIEQPKILKHIDTIKQETVTSQTNNLTRRKDEIKELVAINLSLPQTKSISENKEYSSKPSQSKHKQGESVQQRAPNQEVFIKQRHVTERERLPQQHTSPTELLPARSSDSPTLSEYSSHRNTFISSNALLNSQHSIQIEHFQNSENQNETEYSKSIELPYNQVKPMDGQKPSNRGKNKKVFLLVISIFFFLVAGIVCLFYIIRFKTDKQRVIYES
ncbi:Processed variable antigen [Cucumispora dikerogammari]|nr:Processed variable antigen [Cucumispora dikerogammari]